MSKIVHLTSVHQRFDTRIFLKECRSLVSAGYDVSLIVADDEGDAVRDGVKVFGVGSSRGRFERIRRAPGRVYEKAVLLDADLYHFHDPELIPIGLRLKRLGKRVIFDAHEDVPKQLLSKPYLNRPTRWLLSNLFSVFERIACRKFDAVVAATPFIRRKYLGFCTLVVDINNFPILTELDSPEVEWDARRRQVCYVGGISRIRGITEIVQAIGLASPGVCLELAGGLPGTDFTKALEGLEGWRRVNTLGFLDRSQVREVLSSSIAGLVTLHPTVNYLDALPVKMFEYMVAGIPVIASNFPLWRDIVEGNKCGICVDPLDPHAIAHAMDYLVFNPDVAEQMGRNGQIAVRQKYNWDIEEQKLLMLYRRVLTKHH